MAEEGVAGSVMALAREGEQFMAGLTFHCAYHNAMNAQVVGKLARSVEHHGGKVVARYDANVVTHVVLATTAAADNDIIANGGAAG